MANALIFAARDGDVAEVRWRLEAEPALATYADSHGQSALMWAAVQGHTEVARCLLDFGAALNGTEWEMGRTALYMAAGRGHVAFVDLLLSRGANPALRRAGGRTPLGIAAYNGHTEVVRLLLRHPNADLDGRDDQGCTPLWQAARNGRTASLKLLLAAGADPSVPGEQGWLAIDVAKEKDRVECVALLEGEERAYLLSKARRLHRERQLLSEALEMQYRGLIPDAAALLPPLLLARLARGEQPPVVSVGVGGGGGGGRGEDEVMGTGSGGSGSNSSGASMITSPCTPPLSGRGGLLLLRSAAHEAAAAAGGLSPLSVPMSPLLLASPHTPPTPGCLPRVASEEEEESGLGAKGRGGAGGRDDATAAARYVVEDMRFDVFLGLKELLALSSSPSAAAGAGGGGGGAAAAGAGVETVNSP